MQLKTDNSYLEQKIKLRIDTINLVNKKNIHVLDCFAGKGLIWNEVKKQFPEHDIRILQIEKVKNKNKLALQGDNLKVMKSLNLKQFDIIDLDAYGIPYKQLKEIFNQHYKGYVHVTAIQSGMGALPKDMLKELGFTEEMYKKIKSIFNVNGVKKLENYLYLYGIESVTGFYIDRKSYFYFKT